MHRFRDGRAVEARLKARSVLPDCLVQVTFPLARGKLHETRAARMGEWAIVGPVPRRGARAVRQSSWAWLAACLFAAYAAAQLPLGRRASMRFGARRVQAVLMLLAAIGSSRCFALSPGFAGLAAARIVLGIGVSAGLDGGDQGARRLVRNAAGVALRDRHPRRRIGALGSALTTSPVPGNAARVRLAGRIFWVLCLLALACRDLDFPVGAKTSRASLAPARTLRGGHCIGAVAFSPRGTFWRFGPGGFATLSMFNFAYLGLWAGPWLRDVGRQ